MNCNPPNGFENVKKNFGFGCMRLPMDGDKVDYAEFTRMVDRFMAEGFNYFDTARVYIDGQSETALRDCLVKRYPRESFLLVDKLSTSLFNSEEEIRPLFEKQLAACRMATTELSPLENWKKFRIAYYIFIAAYTLSFIIPVINGWLLWVKLASEITFIAGSISAWNKAIRVDE